MLRAVAFLDRDGTIIVERDYLSDPNQVALEHGALTGLKRLTALGLVLVVVSNQSGIGRGKFDLKAALSVNARTGELLLAHGIKIAGWYMCPHAPEANCDCRKPMPGMACEAARDLRLDVSRSVVIGDKRSDMELAKNIGSIGILVMTGHGVNDRDWAEKAGIAVVADIAAAAELVAKYLATPNYGMPK